MQARESLSVAEMCVGCARGSVCVLLLTGICAFLCRQHTPRVCVRFLGAITTAGRFTGAISRSKFVK